MDAISGYFQLENGSIYTYNAILELQRAASNHAVWLEDGPPSPLGLTEVGTLSETVVLDLRSWKAYAAHADLRGRARRKDGCLNNGKEYMDNV